MGLFDLLKKKKKEQPESQPESAPTMEKHSALERPKGLKTALNRTRAFFSTAFATDPEGLVDEEFYDDFVDAFVMADVGTDYGTELVKMVKQRMSDKGWVHKKDVPRAAREVIAGVLSLPAEPEPLAADRLNVVLMVGVNGSGKTTLSARLAHRLNQAGLQVLLAAADTFRAAATDQLRVWAERIGVDIVAGQEGADPASVVYDAAEAAAARGTEVLIVDTAGRLQTKSNLMQELEKISRTVDKACPGAQVARILVLDATVGQNALSQAELFNAACELTGVAVTKLDGSARGGAVIAVVRRFGLPVLYAGVGEQAGDMVDFDAEEFAQGMMPDDVLGG
jgi:fused signal recognition particle receptor